MKMLRLLAFVCIAFVVVRGDDVYNPANAGKCAQLGNTIVDFANDEDGLDIKNIPKNPQIYLDLVEVIKQFSFLKCPITENVKAALKPLYTIVIAVAKYKEIIAETAGGGSPSTGGGQCLVITAKLKAYSKINPTVKSQAAQIDANGFQDIVTSLTLYVQQGCQGLQESDIAALKNIIATLKGQIVSSVSKNPKVANGLIGTVTGLVGAIPLAGPILGGLLQMVLDLVLGLVLGLVGGLPVVGPLVTGLVGPLLGVGGYDDKSGGGLLGGLLGGGGGGGLLGGLLGGGGGGGLLGGLLGGGDKGGGGGGLLGGLLGGR